MTGIRRIVVLLGVVMCATIAALVVVFVRGAVSQRGVQSSEGYFAPVYSPDGQYVYFIERSTSGIVKQTRSADIMFTPSKFDVQMVDDRFILKRMHVGTGQTENLRSLPPSPLTGTHFEAIGSPFPLPKTQLKFMEDGQLQFKVCVTINDGSIADEYLWSGVWVGAAGANENNEAWKKGTCTIGGYNEWPLSGDWELQEVRDPGYFPVAIVAYNHVTRDIRVFVKNKEYDQLYPSGVPLQKIMENSARTRMEREQTVRRVHKELMQKHKAMGMGEIQAQLRTAEEMQQLGYYPKTTKIVARRLSRTDAVGNIDKDALFRIAKEEMESGIFQDIERAVANPGKEVDYDGGGYLTHRDYSTSARLNKFLQTGATRFYVEYLGETYELTIKRP